MCRKWLFMMLFLALVIEGLGAPQSKQKNKQQKKVAPVRSNRRTVTQAPTPKTTTPNPKSKKPVNKATKTSTKSLRTTPAIVTTPAPPKISATTPTLKKTKPVKTANVAAAAGVVAVTGVVGAAAAAAAVAGSTAPETANEVHAETPVSASEAAPAIDLRSAVPSMADPIPDVAQGSPAPVAQAATEQTLAATATPTEVQGTAADLASTAPPETQPGAPEAALDPSLDLSLLDILFQKEPQNAKLDPLSSPDPVLSTSAIGDPMTAADPMAVNVEPQGAAEPGVEAVNQNEILAVPAPRPEARALDLGAVAEQNLGVAEFKPAPEINSPPETTGAASPTDPTPEAPVAAGPEAISTAADLALTEILREFTNPGPEAPATAPGSPPAEVPAQPAEPPVLVREPFPSSTPVPLGLFNLTSTAAATVSTLPPISVPAGIGWTPFTLFPQTDSPSLSPTTPSPPLGPCPARLEPCTCTPPADPTGLPVLQCTAISTPQELISISGLRNAPGVHFARITLTDTALTHLPINSFGSHTANEYYITRNYRLAHIHAGALGSRADPISLILQENALESFPWTDLANFKRLHYFIADRNRLKEIPDSAFARGSRDVVDILLHDNTIEKLGENAFRNQRQLNAVTLHHNELTEISSHTLSFDSPPNFVTLNNNFIKKVEQDAIDRSPPLYLSLADNLLEILEQDTWIPIFRRLTSPAATGGRQAQIDFKNNPSMCQCNIAWLWHTRRRWETIFSGWICNDSFPSVDIKIVPRSHFVPCF